MTAELLFEMTTSEDKCTLKIKREFAAKRQLVWDCYSKQELLDRWFAPKPLTAKTKHMDFREGGFWHFAMITPEGEKYWSRIDYLTISPIDGYTALDGFSDETGRVDPNVPQSRQNVSFADRGEHTFVTTVITYDSPEDLQKVFEMGLKEGLTSTLERLDELLPTLS